MTRTRFRFGKVRRTGTKQIEMIAGTDTAYTLAKQYKVKTAWGTDTLFDPKLATRQGAQLAKLVRWYSPAEVLKMATADNAEVLALSGPRNPYPGKLGVVEQGALADLLAGRRRSARQHQADRGSRQELQGHHEGREDLQEPDLIPGSCWRRTLKRGGPRNPELRERKAGAACLRGVAASNALDIWSRYQCDGRQQEQETHCTKK